MPNSPRQQAYIKARTLRRREMWKQEHPCACGKPTVSMIAADGKGHIPAVWNGTLERMRRELAKRVILYACEDCVAQLRAWNKEVTRLRRIGYAKRWRDAHPIYGPPVPPKVKEPKAPKPPKAEKPPRAPRTPRPRKTEERKPTIKGPRAIPFLGASFECMKCFDRFPRYALLVRHMREDHGVYTQQAS